MSSILKALKKVEHDQNAHKPKTLLAPVHGKPGGSSFAGTAMLGIALVCVLAGGIAYFTMKQTTSPETPLTEPPLATLSPLNSIQAESRPAQAAVPDQSVTVKKVEIPVVQSPKSNKPASLSQKPLHTTENRITVTKPVTAEQKLQKPAPTAPASAVSERIDTTITAIDTAPRLEVNGIAYQGENGDSIAVVNGVPVSKNSIIEGVMVKDILADKVIFSRKGKTFGVDLGKISP